MESRVKRTSGDWMRILVLNDRGILVARVPVLHAFIRQLFILVIMLLRVILGVNRQAALPLYSL